jgi:predicted amidohydrolase
MGVCTGARRKHYGGHSIIYNPYGDNILKIDHDQEEVVVADLDLKLTSEFRKKFDVREDRNEYENNP